MNLFQTYILILFQKAVEGIRECYANEYFAEIFKKNLNSIPKTAKAANEVIETIQAARLAKSVADFIQADVHAMQGIATGMASPGLQAFGKTLIVAGSTAAKVLSGSLAALGIITGIWDIVDGVKDINGSAHANAYREAGNQIKGNVDNIDVLLKSLKN